MVNVAGDPGFPAWTNSVDASLASKISTAAADAKFLTPTTANATYAPASGSTEYAPFGSTVSADLAAMLPWLAQPASYTTVEDKLSTWRAALAAQATTLAQVLCIGDSITEGTGASTAINRWQNAVQRSLRAQVGSLVGAEWPWIPGFPATSATGFPVVRTGNVAAATGSNPPGLNGRSAIIQDATGVLTFTFTGTRAKVVYFKGSITGTANIVLDGGAAVVIDTNSVTGGGASNAATWDTGVLTAGVHTVVVTRDATSPSTKHPYINGLLTYNGDETTGVRLVDAGRHGISSATVTTGYLSHLTANMTTCGTFALAVIAIGTNDYGIPTAPATFKANIDGVITALRGAGFTGSIALVHTYRGSARSAVTWATYGAQLALIAAGDSLVSYYALGRRMPDDPTPYTDPVGLGLFNDTLHPSDAGHAWIGRVMADYLALRA